MNNANKLNPIVVILRIFFYIIIAIVAAAVLLVLVLTVTEFKSVTEAVKVNGISVEKLKVSDTVKLVTSNVGYGGLGAEQDSFLDGGTMVRPDDQEDVEKNLAGISKLLDDLNADIYMMQEVDTASKRSYFIDERMYLCNKLGVTFCYGINYKCLYVPFPLPTIGTVTSGLMTVSDKLAAGAERVALPVSFSWPVSTANLKRCLLVERFALEGSDKELVVVNMHLEAYDNGEGKIAQTKVLIEYLQQEYAKGNYVIAGGDFNQTFYDISQSPYPIVSAEYWMPGEMSESILPEGWRFAYDDSTPTCRLLNKPYDGVEPQFYVIDGFILSPNVKVESVRTVDGGFQYSDHNPVELTVTLEWQVE